MREYANIIRNTLSGKDTGYRYPGEILERCVVSTPEKADEVLEGFLEFVSSREELDMLRNTPNAFNSNQIDMFVECIGNYKAARLKFLLTKETAAVNANYLNSVDDYVYLGEYIDTLEDNEADNGVVRELKAEFSKTIPLMKKTVYEGELLGIIVYYIEHFGLADQYQKEEKNYLKLMRKATDNIFSDSELLKLQSYGYSLLKIRKLNAINLRSYVTGRRDKAWFLFLKEAFFGAEVLSEKDKAIISAKIEANEEWKLERVINGEKTMLSALSIYEFKESSVNASFCLSFMPEYGQYDMTRTISLEGDIFNSFSTAQKNTIYKQYLRYSFDDEKLRYCKEKTLDCDQEGSYLSGLNAERVIQLIDKGILAVDELDTPNVKIRELVSTAFRKASKTNLEILRRYAGKAPNVFECLNRCGYYDRKETDGIYLVKGENLSEDEIKELYEIKENYFFRYAPFLYVNFILSVIKESKTMIHSKEEWLSLLNYLEEIGSDVLRVKKEILTEDEYTEIIRKNEEKKKDQQRSSLMEQIKIATSVNDIEWYHISKDMLDVKRAAYLKILELNTYSWKAVEKIADFYYEDIISDEEFLAFHKRKKELKRREEAA